MIRYIFYCEYIRESLFQNNILNCKVGCDWTNEKLNTIKLLALKY